MRGSKDNMCIQRRTGRKGSHTYTKKGSIRRWRGTRWRHSKGRLDKGKCRLKNDKIYDITLKKI